MNKLEIDTRNGKLLLNGKELENVTEVNIKLHDDDRTSVMVLLSPCEVDAHIGIKNGHNDWTGGS